MKWVGDVYKQYLDLKLAIGNLEPGVQISAHENSDGSAQALLRFSREGASSTGPLSVEQAATLEPQSAEIKKSMELVVYWMKDTWGIWRLDGKTDGGGRDRATLIDGPRERRATASLPSRKDRAAQEPGRTESVLDDRAPCGYDVATFEVKSNRRRASVARKADH